MPTVARIIPVLRSSQEGFDKEIEVDDKNWALTLATVSSGSRSGGHAVIFYEGCENGLYFLKKIHLKVSATPVVEERNITAYRNRIRYVAKTKTVGVPRSSIQAMLHDNENGRKYDHGVVTLLGSHSIINAPAKRLGYESHNCFTWAVERIHAAGLKLTGFNPGVFVCDTKNHINENTNFISSYENIFDLYLFAKTGNVHAIKKFPKDFDANQLVETGSGPVEAHLGKYTPLAIAIAYKKFSAVRTLITRFSIDPFVKSGRFKNFTALDCAKQNWWGSSKDVGFFQGKPDEKILDCVTKYVEKISKTTKQAVTADKASINFSFEKNRKRSFSGREGFFQQSVATEGLDGSGNKQKKMRLARKV